MGCVRQERGRGVWEGRLGRARGRAGTGAAAGAEPGRARAKPGGGLRSGSGLGKCGLKVSERGAGRVRARQE